jgi:hypothetical protein
MTSDSQYITLPPEFLGGSTRTESAAGSRKGEGGYAYFDFAERPALVK